MKQAFRVAYHGRNFHGFQRQLHVKTAEHEISSHLSKKHSKISNIFDLISQI